jgi:hypothetical protein
MAPASDEDGFKGAGRSTRPAPHIVKAMLKSRRAFSITVRRLDSENRFGLEGASPDDAFVDDRESVRHIVIRAETTFSIRSSDACRRRDSPAPARQARKKRWPWNCPRIACQPPWGRGRNVTAGGPGQRKKIAAPRPLFFHHAERITGCADDRYGRRSLRECRG